MKKFFVILGLVFVCITAFAHSVEWYVDGSLYQTTTCDAGDSITPPTAPAKYGYHFVKWSAYTQLEYIESTGTQYIDTGYSAPEGFVLKIQLMVLNNKRSAIFGSHDPTAPYGRNDLFLSEGRRFEFGADYAMITNFSVNSDEIYDITLSTVKNDVFFSVKEPYFYSKYENASYLSSNNLYLFDINGYTFDNFIGRIYSAQIYDNDVLVRDLIPAKRNSDNAVGMYDTVTNTFFTNAGTGEFIAGPEVGDL